MYMIIYLRIRARSFANCLLPSSSSKTGTRLDLCIVAIPSSFRSPVYCIGSFLGVRLPRNPLSRLGISLDTTTSCTTLSYMRCCSCMSSLYLVRLDFLVNALVFLFLPCGPYLIELLRFKYPIPIVY